MKRFHVLSLVAIAAIVGALAAQDDIRRGSIKKVDADAKTLTLNVDGKDLTLKVDPKTRVMNADGKESKEPFREKVFNAGAQVMFKLGPNDVPIGIRVVGDAKQGKKQPLAKVDSSRLVPIDELGDKEYKDGVKGGFYPDGKNGRPKEHEAAGLRLAKEIQPLNAAGKPDPQGKIVLLSIGMSNTAQASQGFAKVLASAGGVNPRVQFVNGAMGGMTAFRTQYTDNADGVKYWSHVDQMLKKGSVAREQVQVIWIKQADAGPKTGFPAYAKTLEEELARIVQILPKRFPNARMVYLSSRTYGGYATTGLNPEPYAYESAFSVKWLIERQIKGDAALNFDPKKGEVKAPWLSWGPYLWANGSKMRADGFSYEEADFTPNDRTHLTPVAQEKVGRLMLRFFQADSTTRTWFNQ
jgi:hypothetical protein